MTGQAVTLSIIRTNGDEPELSVQLRFGAGKTITASMTTADFAMATTGRSEVDVELRLRNVKVEIIK